MPARRTYDHPDALPRAKQAMDAALKTKPSRAKLPVLRVGLAGFVAVALLVLVLQPWWLAPLVAHQLSASSRRAVRIDAMWLSLSASFQPVVQLRGVRIDNAPWADSPRPFAALASVSAVFSWRSLDERRPVIALMVLRDGEVDLERRSDGLRNWRLAHPDDRGPGRVKLLAIRGERATVRVLHGPLALDLEARATPHSGGQDAADGDGKTVASPPPAASAGESAADPSMPTVLDVRGTWRGVPFVIGATTAETLTLLETGQTFRLRGSIDAAGARLDLDGRLGDVVRWPRVDARVALAAPSLAPLAAPFGAHLGETKRLRIAGVLHGDADGYALTESRARLGATDLTGELRWTRGEQRDRVRAELKSDSADLDDLRALVGGRPAPAAAAAPAVIAASAPAPSAHPLDAELHFVARRLHDADLPWLRSASLSASLVDRRLDVTRFEAGVGEGGHAAGRAFVDLAGKPAHGDAEIDVSALRVESLLGELAAKSGLSGVLHGRATLRASGDSLEALIASAAGSLEASLSGGTISSLLDAKMGLQGGRILRSMLAGAEPIAIRCAAVALDVRNGQGRIRTLVVDT
ncbi:MAG TPA: AsmA family protein, partial [Caldimonas sp.]